jgi:putative sterol carrier protein
MKPEFVAPVVLYLAAEECRENGMIFNAASGFFSRTAIVTGPGAVVAKEGKVPTIEDIKANWEAINVMEGAKEFDGATAALGDMMAAFTPKKEDKAAKKKGPGAAEIFEKLPDAFQTDAAAGVEVTFQFTLSGEGGGDWHAIIKDGAIEVKEGKHESPTTTILMSAEDFVGLIQGKVNAMLAYTSGKLKIEGDLMKSQLIEKLFKF